MSASYIGNKYVKKKQQSVYRIYNKEEVGRGSIVGNVGGILPPIMKKFNGKTQSDFGKGKDILFVKRGDKLVADENRNFLKETKQYSENNLQGNLKRNSDENSNSKNNKITDDYKLPEKYSNNKQDNKTDNYKIISVENPSKKDEKIYDSITIDNPSSKLFDSKIEIDLFQNEQNDQEENEALINFMTNLDFGKYLKDLHIREALHLIRNKIEKQAELEIAQTEENLESNKDGDSHISNTEKNENIKPYLANLISHDQEWNNSIKLTPSELFKNKDDQMKTEMADKILKSENKFRNVHSVQSVKRLLDREGITGKVNINPLKISVIKETAIIKNYNHISTILPNMRDLPLI